MVKLSLQSYLFDPRPDYPLVTTVKRYWDASSDQVVHDDGLTLIFAHGTGFHKEHWEPTVEDLYSLLKTQSQLKIREVWSLDAPNHGDAAILNEKTLQWGYEPIFRWDEYARSIHAFLAGLGTGVEVDFSRRRLVGVGQHAHVGFWPSLSIPNSMIMVEMMCMSQSFTEKFSRFLPSGSMNRRDVWPSKEEAYKLLKSRGAWKLWDDRVLRIYVEQGLRTLPTAEYPDKTEGVTLKCTRKQETACYQDSLGHSRVYRFLDVLAKRVPVHLIYGAIDDYLPAVVKEDVIDTAAGGIQNLASVRRVDNAGHLVVQMNPLGLAQAIHDALAQQLFQQSKL